MQRRVTLVLRITIDEAGHTSGVLELARTGRKEAVRDIGELSGVVLEMLRSAPKGEGPCDTLS